MKVQTKLILGFLIIYLLFGLALFVSVSQSSKELERTASEDLLALAREAASHIDKDINERVKDIRVYSKDLELMQFVAQSNGDFEKLSDIKGYIDSKDMEWTSVPKNEITQFMQQLIDNKISKEMMQRIKFYEDDFGYRLYGEIFATNKYGANVAQTGKTSDYRQDDEDWWQKTKSDGIYVEELKYDQSADIYSTSLGIRIDGGNDEFMGVIKAVLNLEEIINIIREADAEKNFKSADFTLVDEKGRVIFSTRNYEIFEPFGMFSEIQGKEGVLKANEQKTGMEKLFIYAHSQGYGDFKGLGWILVVDIERGEVLKPINDLILTILIFGMVLIVLAGVIGFYIYSTISNSLGKFEDTINEIAKGNLEARVEIKTRDEFRALADAFNSMADQLKSLKKVEKKQKMEKELDALEASYKTGFISEETYKKERKRLEENIIKTKAVDAKLLQERGLIKKQEEV